MTLNFFWSKFGLTRKALETVDQTWVQTMISVANAESEVTEYKMKNQSNNKGGMR